MNRHFILKKLQSYYVVCKLAEIDRSFLDRLKQKNRQKENLI
jgi:hypothetical protein